MLPFFGNTTSPGLGVKGWMMAKADFISERPSAPPIATQSEMKNQVDEVSIILKTLPESVKQLS